jgi:sulfur-carrier protein
MANASAPNPTTAVTVILSATLVRLFPGCEPRVQVVTARSVAELLDALDGRWPGMRDRIRDSTPAIRRHMSVFVDGRRARLETPLTAGGLVYILTSMSGG